jgi:hypothetical protein
VIEEAVDRLFERAFDVDGDGGDQDEPVEPVETKMQWLMESLAEPDVRPCRIKPEWLTPNESWWIERFGRDTASSGESGARVPSVASSSSSRCWRSHDCARFRIPQT